MFLCVSVFTILYHFVIFLPFAIKSNREPERAGINGGVRRIYSLPGALVLCRIQLRHLEYQRIFFLFPGFATMR